MTLLTGKVILAFLDAVLEQKATCVFRWRAPQL